MSQKKLNSKKLGYRLSVGTSAGLTIASVFTPVLQTVVRAEDISTSSSTIKRTSNQNEMMESTEQSIPTISSSNETEQSMNSSTENEHSTSSSQGTGTSSTGSSSGNVGTGSSHWQKPSPPKKPTPPKPKPSKPASEKPAPKEENKPVAKGNEVVEDNQPIRFLRNQSTAEFIQKIGEEARDVANKNDLYASVMIAQAILESASGNSTLARSPNHNLFGIKGTYKGKSVNMPTLEDNGKGQMYSIKSSFRKYPSYKESLEDYAKLLKGGTGYVSTFYQGTWKSNTKNYKEATAFLTGKYATDTKYNLKLNGLIETYELDKYDGLKEKTAEKKTTDTIHKVAEKESLWKICEQYGSSLSDVMEWNQLTTNLVFVGQELIVKKGETVVTKTEEKSESPKKIHKKEKEMDDKKLVLSKASEVGESLRKKLPSVFYDENNYKVSAKRKKSNQKYHVMKGDSLKSISERNGIPINKLIEWNDLDKKILTEGQSLNISSPFSSYI